MNLKEVQKIEFKLIRNDNINHIKMGLYRIVWDLNL